MLRETAAARRRRCRSLVHPSLPAFKHRAEIPKINFLNFIEKSFRLIPLFPSPKINEIPTRLLLAGACLRVFLSGGGHAGGVGRVLVVIPGQKGESAMGEGGIHPAEGSLAYSFLAHQASTQTSSSSIFTE